MTKQPLTSILVKPAGPDCNMDCGYCFYSGKSELYPGSATHRMTDTVLEEMMRQFMNQPSPDLSLGWQGGEPTLMGLSFFERAVELEEKYGEDKTVGNGLQTNGILLDHEWATFLKKYNFLVGLSIDGPQHVHDCYRHMRSGAGTWSRISETARMLLDEGVSVNALTVVSDYSVRFPDEIYDHHHEAGLDYMQFIPCVETDPQNPQKAAPFSVSARDYGTFLCRIYDRWRQDFIDDIPQTSVRFFESLLFSYAGFTPPDCTLGETCGTYLVVEHNGDVYSCDFFVEPAWHLGNIMEASLTSLFTSDQQKEFGLRKVSLPETCLSCPWLAQCHGGCPKDRQRDPRDRGINHFCEAFKIFFQHADADLRALTDKWREKTEKERERRKRVALAGTVKRNDPCPCGSGLKYKKCCGR